MEMRKKMWQRKEIVTLPPLYIWAPGSTHAFSLVVIHESIEVVVIGVGSPINVASSWMGNWINWAVIDHVSWGVASSTDPKIANLIGVSPSMTEITLGRQTMMLNELARECLSGRHKEWENAMYYLARECLGEQLLSNKVTMKE